MIFTSFNAIVATFILAKISSGLTSTVIAEGSMMSEKVRQMERYYKINAEKFESTKRKIRDVEKDENFWRQSSLEELAFATGPNSFSSISTEEEKKYLTKSENDEKILKEDWKDAVPGVPYQDYPNYASIPVTSFTCSNKSPGGYYADIETGCQVFHVCNIGGIKSSFLCPPGSIFNQRHFVCDWWYRFNCEEALDLYTDQLKKDIEESTQEISKFQITKTVKNDTILIKNHPEIPARKNYWQKEKEFEEEVEKNPTNDLFSTGSKDQDSSYLEEASTKMLEASRNFKDKEYNDKIPRGFSRHSADDSLPQKNVIRVFDDSTNDLASYVNHAYFDARSENDLNNNNNSDNNNNNNNNGRIR